MGGARTYTLSASIFTVPIMHQNNRSRWQMLLPFIPVLFGLALLVIDSRPQQALRNNLFDQYQRWHPRAYADVPVRIVDIDDASLARIGQWPWPRTRIAELLEKLGAGGAAAVAFDVMFAEPDRTSPQVAADLWHLSGRLRDELLALPDHDRVFARSLEQGDAVIGFAVERSKAAQPGGDAAARIPEQKARFIHSGEQQEKWLHTFSSAVTSMPALEAAAKGNGALTFVPDGDGVVRRVPLVLQLGSTPVPTLASEALRVAQGTKNIIMKTAGQNSGLAEIRIGELTIPTTPQGEIWVHYSKPVPERYVPAWQVLAGQVPPERLDGHIVLIGTSAQGLMDLRFNPFGLIAGVEAHAQAIEQILSGHFLGRPSWARGVETLVLMVTGLAVGLLALRARALVAAAVGLLLLAAILGGGWYAFVAHDLLLDPVTPALGLVLTFVICSLTHHLSSEREQRWIKDAFSRYVSPNRVSYLVDNPDAMALGGRRQDCSFIFTDLAGFTSLMEAIDPGAAVALLNVYLDEMIAIAFRHDGTLDRIVGDAVAIMFSAPVPQADHRARALVCALEMDTYASGYAKKIQAEGIPFGKTRIGVHAGEVIVGNFGGTNIFDYRALGDPVNTAARLESVNKHLGTRMCVSESILSECPEARVRPVGRLVLKGKSQALAVFEPLIEELAATCAPLDVYTAAFELLRTEDARAADAFLKLAEGYPDDPLALHNRRLQAGERGDLIVMSEK
jgi:adenylate cyclase